MNYSVDYSDEANPKMVMRFPPCCLEKLPGAILELNVNHPELTYEFKASTNEALLIMSIKSRYGGGFFDMSMREKHEDIWDFVNFHCNPD